MKYWKESKQETVNHAGAGKINLRINRSSYKCILLKSCIFTTELTLKNTLKTVTLSYGQI